ncbi:transposase [Streptomyces sp. SAI-208]|nr:transposase [Streptomyces sp. SAI-208]
MRNEPESASQEGELTLTWCIMPVIARRGTEHGSGLGVYRWVVERAFAWLHGFRRLRVRWERRADIHEAFLRLACCLITHRQLQSFF